MYHHYYRLSTHLWSPGESELPTVSRKHDPNNLIFDVVRDCGGQVAVHKRALPLSLFIIRKYIYLVLLSILV